MEQKTHSVHQSILQDIHWRRVASRNTQLSSGVNSEIGLNIYLNPQMMFPSAWPSNQFCSKLNCTLTTWESISEGALTELVKMDTGLIRPSLSALMMGNRPKTTLLKHLLAHLILSNITIEGSTPGSFLPRDICTLYKSMEDATEHQKKTGQSKRDLKFGTLLTLSQRSHRHSPHFAF
jgi:hypothetical protein